MKIYRVLFLILAFSLFFSLKTLDAEIKKNHLIVGTIAELLSNAKFFELDQERTWQQLTAETSITLDDFLLDVFLTPNDINPYLNQVHPICQSPALFLWLKSKLPYDFQKLELPYCDALDQFYQEISPTGLSLLVVHGPIQESLFLKIKAKNEDYVVDFTPIDLPIGQSTWQGMIGDLPYRYVWMKASAFHLKLQQQGYDFAQVEAYEAKLLVPNAHKIVLMYLWQVQNQVFRRSFWHNQRHLALLKLIDLTLAKAQSNQKDSLLWPYSALDALKRLDRSQMVGQMTKQPAVANLQESGGQTTTQWNRGHFGHALRAGLGVSHGGDQQAIGSFQTLSFALFSQGWSDAQLGFPSNYVQQWLKIDLRYQADPSQAKGAQVGDSSDPKALMIQDLVFWDWFKLNSLESQKLSWRVKSALWGERYGYVQGTMGAFTSLFRDRVQLFLGPELRLQKDFDQGGQMFQVNGSVMVRGQFTDKLLLSIQGGYRLGAFGDSQKFGVYEILSENQYQIRSWLNVYYRLNWQSALVGLHHILGVGVYF